MVNSSHEEGIKKMVWPGKVGGRMNGILLPTEVSYTETVVRGDILLGYANHLVKSFRKTCCSLHVESSARGQKRYD